MDLDFLRAVVPQNEGYFFLWALDDPAPAHEKKNHSSGYRASNTEKARHFLDHKELSPTHGIYFTPWTYTQREWGMLNGKNKHPRAHDEYRLTCRTLWVDLDVGAGAHKYPDKATALKALLLACDDSGAMPKPSILVDSGGGIHAYWTMSGALELPEWLTAARRLQKYFVTAGVKLDHGISTDAARIMRLPGTMNHKLATPRPCKVLGGIGLDISNEFIERWPELTEADLQASPKAPGPAISGLFRADGEDMGAAQDFAPKHTKHIVERCEVFRRIHADHGATCSEPLWKDVLQTVKMTEDADEWAHELSSGHPSYSREDTEAKMAQRTLGKGITCSGFAAHYADDEDHPCHGCPLQGQGHSPLRMGGEQPPIGIGAEEDPLEGQPRYLHITPDGMVVRSYSKKDDPVDTLISQSRVVDIEALAEDTLKGVVPFMRIGHITGGRSFSRLLNMNALGSSAEGRKALNSTGLAIPHMGYGEMARVFSDWHSQLAKAGRVTQLNRVQGWQEEDFKLTGFVHGDKVYNVGGGVEDSGFHSDDGTAAIYTPVGDGMVWKEAAKHILASENPALISMLAASFGAALVKLLGSAGGCASLSYYSTISGVGKSTALRVARAIWAHPNTFAVLDDTYNGVMATLRRAPNLPLMWDDPRKPKTRADLRELLFQVAAGRTKQRSNVDGTPSEVVTMQTLGIVTSNEPLLGELSVTTGIAEAKRVLEVQVPAAKLTAPDAIFSELDDNYGHAGAVFIEYVTQNLGLVRDRLTETKKIVRAALGHDASDRFYVNTVTVSLVGAEIAHSAGLVAFAPKPLLEYFRKVVTNTRDETTSALAEYTTESDVLAFITSRGVDGGVMDEFSRSSSAMGEILVRPADPMRPWHYVIEDCSGTLRIMMSRFREWYVETHGRPWNIAGWCERARQEGILKEHSARRSLAVGNLTFPGHNQVRVMVVRLPTMINVSSKKIREVSKDDAEAIDA